MPTGNLRLAREADLPVLIELARRSWLSAFAQTAPFSLIAWWARENPTAACRSGVEIEDIFLERALANLR